LTTATYRIYYKCHMKFEWDPEKAVENQVKHGISFDQAIKAFDDPQAIFITDIEHSEYEQREWLIGAADDKGIVLVVFTEREGDITRIISARKATLKERMRYVKNETTD
jgi:uncharacterized DUF497 family protein